MSAILQSVQTPCDHIERSGLAGMKQRDLIKWYVDQQNEKNNYSSVEEAKVEISQIKAIIEVCTCFIDPSKKLVYLLAYMLTI
jgi:hypothetical protein